MAALRTALADVLGEPVADLGTVRGGDIHVAYRVTLRSGRVVFAKTSASAPPDMFAREAEGLAWLAESTSLHVPIAIGVSADPPLLCLPWIERAPPAHDHDAVLGRGLAQLHARREPTPGLDRSNYIATLTQDNRSLASWPRFFAERRVLPSVRALRDQGALSHGHAAVFDALSSRFDDLLATDERASRLHGDLWGGNTLTNASGAPCLVDPAVYAGHREVDLAMMRLFGGFSAGVFDAYHEALPLEPGSDDRVALYQLWPLLVHARLFGGGYVDRAVRTARRFVDR